MSDALPDKRCMLDSYVLLHLHMYLSGFMSWLEAERSKVPAMTGGLTHSDR